jgi:N-methylhydantoinase A
MTSTIAFDIGGTFTDFALHAPDGAVTIWKVPTTPRAPADAVIASLRQSFADGTADPAAIGSLLHATTIATNAILERKGARVALITTAGFRDVLLIARQKRYDTNNLHLDKPQPLARRRDIFEVPERVAADGSIIHPLDEAAAARIAHAVAAGGYDAAAVVFLHAYANPAHEQRMAALLAEAAPGLNVTLSSVISPKFREYERTNTTVANAYVAPLVAGYLDALSTSLSQLGVRAELSIMQSNGGLASTALARAYPIRIVESGPTAGVLFCAEVGREEGFDHVMTFDMGGTTAKLGAIDNGQPAVTPVFEVDTVSYKKGSGLPLNVMAVELLEIGAGGGSIARTRMGLIGVGPDSAGADPGPICYGHGGAEPTITDANLVLGYLNPDYFNGGAMRLDLASAAAGIERDIGAPLGLPLHQAAWGIHSVANANMERAMRIVSIERGRDPRRYALVAFGGAGPLHACRLARALEIPRVIVPRGAGVGSALGLLVAERKFDIALTRIVRLDGARRDAIAAIFAELEARMAGEARHLGAEGALRLQRSASMHHVGQGYELRIDLPDGPIGAEYEQAMRQAFYAAYRREYGYTDPEAGIEVTDWYLVGVATGTRAGRSLRLESEHAGRDPVVGERAIWLPEAGGLASCKVIDRYALTEAHRFTGPLLVEERECTTLVLPGDSVSLSTAGNLVIDLRRPA